MKTKRGMSIKTRYQRIEDHLNDAYGLYMSSRLEKRVSKKNVQGVARRLEIVVERLRGIESSWR